METLTTTDGAITITTKYDITPAAYEPNCFNGSTPAEYDVFMIWYGDTRYPSIDELREDHPDAADEIEDYLEGEINN